MTKGIIQTEQQWPRKQDWYMGKNERDEIRGVYLNEGDERSRKAPWGRRTVSGSGDGEREEWWALECRVQAGMWEPQADVAACGTVWVRKVWKCHQVSTDAQSAQPRRSKGAGWQSLCSVGCRADQWALILDPARCRGSEKMVQHVYHQIVIVLAKDCLWKPGEAVAQKRGIHRSVQAGRAGFCKRWMLSGLSEVTDARNF